MPLPMRSEAPQQQHRKRKLDELPILDEEVVEAKLTKAIEEIWPTHPYPGAMPNLIQLFIGNLPGSVTTDDIINLLFAYDIRTMFVDFISKRKKSQIAFVTILEKDKDKAISLLHKKDYQGHRIKVEVATKQNITPPTIWSTGGRVCFCKYSQSAAGRCEKDELTHIDDSPRCPFGSHDRGMFVRLCASVAALEAEDKKPTPEQLSRRDNKKRRRMEEQSITMQRQKAADPKSRDEQAAKCRDILERKSGE